MARETGAKNEIPGANPDQRILHPVDHKLFDFALDGGIFEDAGDVDLAVDKAFSDRHRVVGMDEDIGGCIGGLPLDELLYEERAQAQS